MSDFFSKILDHKKDEVRAAAQRVPERVLRQEAEKSNRQKTFH